MISLFSKNIILPKFPNVNTFLKIRGFRLFSWSWSKELLHCLANLSGLIEHLNKVHEAFQHLSFGDSWRLNSILAILIEVGKVLNGAVLGCLHGKGLLLKGICFLKALNTVLQCLLIQVAVPVSSLDEAGGRDDKVLVVFQLLQILAGLAALLAALLFAAVFALRHWHGKGKGKEEDEKCLHAWAPTFRMALVALLAALLFA